MDTLWIVVFCLSNGACYNLPRDFNPYAGHATPHACAAAMAKIRALPGTEKLPAGRFACVRRDAV